MNCPKCGSNVNPGENFCRICGSQLEIQPQVQQNNVESQTTTVSQSNPGGQVVQPVNQPVNNAQPQYSNVQNNDDELIKTYIGKNAEKLMDNKFSWCSFLFSTMYYLYRKMWLIGVCWLVGSSIITSYLPTYGPSIIFIGNIIMAIQFKKLYLKNVKEKVEKIKSENIGKSREELLSICRNKGGVAIWPVIVSAVIYLILIIVLIFSVFALVTLGNWADYFKEGETDSNLDTNSEYVLKYDISLDFEESAYNTDTYQSYTYSTTADYCTLTIKVNDNYYDYSSGSEYLDNTVYYSDSDTVSDIEEVSINGNKWNYISILSDLYGNEYDYAIIKNDYVYDISFRIYQDDTGTCTEAYSDLVDSLEF